MLIYSAKTYGDGPFRKICVHLISQFFSSRENRENFMLAKYTWFTVCVLRATTKKSVVFFGDEKCTPPPDKILAAPMISSHHTHTDDVTAMTTFIIVDFT